MNYFAHVLTTLYEHIKNNVPEIKHIDQEIGQLEDYEIRPALAFPAVLIDFADTTYSEISTLAQIGEITINFKLIFAPFSNSSHITPTTQISKALEFYDIEQKLYQCLQGHYIENYTTPLIRTRATTERNSPDLRVRNLSFTSSFQDLSATALTQKLIIPLKTQISIN